MPRHNGNTLVRLDAESIAQRRQIIELYYRLGYGPGAILKALRAEAPQLIDRQADQHETIRDDLRVVKRRLAARLQAELDRLLAPAGFDEPALPQTGAPTHPLLRTLPGD